MAATTYQVEPTQILEDGTTRKIAFKNSALDVSVGQLSPGSVDPEIASDPNEMLSRTIANIKAHLINLKGLSEVLRQVSDTDTDTNEENIPSTKVTNSLKTQIDALKASMDDMGTEMETKAPTNHASSATTYGIGTDGVYGHVKLSDVFGSVQENGAAANGIAASQNAVGSAYMALDAAKAPNDHAVAADTYGKGTATLYGHVRVSDVFDTTSVDNAEVASRKALYDAYKSITDKVDDGANGLASKAPIAHASSATTYGVGSGTNYGHLKISDSFNTDNSTSGAAANGVAASSWAVYRAYSTLNTAINGKLASSHANETATATAFSHVKLSDAYKSSAGAASQGIGASSKAVYDAYAALSGSITSLQTSVNSLNTAMSKRQLYYLDHSLSINISLTVGQSTWLNSTWSGAPSNATLLGIISVNPTCDWSIALNVTLGFFRITGKHAYSFTLYCNRAITLNPFPITVRLLYQLD